MFDLKNLSSILDDLEKERKISKEDIISAIEFALAAAYKKQYGKKGQIIRAKFDPKTGQVEFKRIKIVVDNSLVREPGEERKSEDDRRPVFNPEKHIKLEDAKMIKKDAKIDDEIEFVLEPVLEFGRIASQTAKQVIMQKLREAEKKSVLKEYSDKVGEIVTGEVQRFERGRLYLDLGRAIAVMPYEEQIPGERFRQGSKIKALLYYVGESAKDGFIKVSRTRPEFIAKLFELESPEMREGVVKVYSVAREPGSRSKIAVYSEDERIDPIGALVGQRGVRVSIVTSELGGEKIDIIEYVDDIAEFIANALSPADVLEVELDEENKKAIATVPEDQHSLAIGRGGQNVRLASKLTGWNIDIRSTTGQMLTEEGREIEQEQETPDTIDSAQNKGEEESGNTDSSQETELNTDSNNDDKSEQKNVENASESKEGQVKN